MVHPRQVQTANGAPSLPVRTSSGINACGASSPMKSPTLMALFSRTTTPLKCSHPLTSCFNEPAPECFWEISNHQHLQCHLVASLHAQTHNFQFYFCDRLFVSVIHCTIHGKQHIRSFCSNEGTQMFGTECPIATWIQQCLRVHPSCLLTAISTTGATFPTLGDNQSSSFSFLLHFGWDLGFPLTSVAL